MSGEADIDGATAAWRTRVQGLRRRLGAGDLPGLQARLSALDALSDRLLADRTVNVAGMAFLAGFLRRSNLEHLLAREIPHPAALERFVSIDERKSGRLLPKGVVAHWIAGNVPLLGMFSWALSALVGNVNVIRLSSRQDDFVSPILAMLAQASPAGARMADDTVVLSFDRHDTAQHGEMSLLADVRIAWGGMEAVDAVRGLPAQWECETLALGPRVSLAVVDPALVGDRMTGRLVSDIVYFDQLACSSPQKLFVKGRAGDTAFDAFTDRFISAFERQSRAVPRHALDYSETYRIAIDRTRILLEGGTLRRDAGTTWTVAMVDQPVPDVLCANRFVQVVPFADVDEVCRFIPSNVQTAVTVLGAEDFERFTEAAARSGVCRFPRPGDGNSFETPWDGTPLVTRLTRWATRTDAV